MRQGLRIFLGLDPEIEIVGEAADGGQAIELACRLQPDVVLMDLLMPHGAASAETELRSGWRNDVSAETGGVKAIGVIRQSLPDTEVIALTSVLEDDLVIQAVQAGAIGYLLKDTEAHELRRAIKAAAAGELILSPKAAARLLRDMRPPSNPEPLTEREREVLGLLARGKSNKEIAGVLHVSAPTVKTHVSSILNKLGVASRTQAALYAIRSGLVSPDALERRAVARNL